MFCVTLRRCLRYLQGPPNIFDYVGKKIRIISYVADKISPKRLGGGKYLPPQDD
eukprot:UN00695